ncbi:hypothetical protein Q0P45_13770, partial [Staphylococcus aureus]|nr:hypothetical protein [Staphylococcus aureus]
SSKPTEAGYGRPSAAPPGTAVGQTGRQVGDSGGVESELNGSRSPLTAVTDGPVGVDAAEATTECDVELEEMAKKP